MILGIDFHKRYTQLSILSNKSEGVKTFTIEEDKEAYNIPLMLLRDGEGNYNLKLLENEGEEVIIDIEDENCYELLLIYIRLIMELMCANEAAARVCVCSYVFEFEVLERIRKALITAKIDENTILMLNRPEAIASYILDETQDIRNGSVVVFDYAKEGLYVYDLVSKRVGTKDCIAVTEKDCKEELPYLDNDSSETRENIDHMLCDIALKAFDKKNVSAVFLCGEGFDNGRRYESFLKFVCNKRRVFMGQNLYSAGACFMGYNEYNKQPSYLVECKDKIMYNLDLDIVEWGQNSLLRIVRSGTNWYRARKKFAFFLGKGTKELTLHRSDDSKNAVEDITVELPLLPERDHLACKLSVGFDFLKDGSCKVLIRDKGFGDFVKATNVFVQVEI